MEKPYTNLPLTGPHDIGVGHALLTMVEPHIGHEREYNRWYEDDHIFSGALFLPWLFSGRRWVATYNLQQLRYPKNSPITDPVTNGCYFSTYWITAGRIDCHKEWSFSVYGRLAKERRVNDNRDHIYTAFQDKVGTIYRDHSVPNDVFSLMDPAGGLVLEIVDAPTPERRDDLESWLLEVHLPARVIGNNLVSSAMIFRTTPTDPNIKVEVLERIGKITASSNDPRRLTILWFIENDPSEIWDEFFVPEAKMVTSGGLGEVSLIAPFIPAKMGTNTYDDMLRAPING